jgi:folate-binding protein YgfZ
MSLRWSDLNAAALNTPPIAIVSPDPSPDPWPDPWPNTSRLCALPQHAVLEVAGADAQSFLQGQLTCDVQALVAGKLGCGAYCSPKGRMLSSFLIWRGASQSESEVFHLLLPASLAEAIRKRLTMFVLRAKVSIRLMQTPLLGCVGIAAAASPMAEPINTTSPWQGHSQVLNGLGQWLSLRIGDGLQRHYLLAESEAALDTWLATQSLDSANITHPVFWDWLDIQAGLPLITPATQEQFTPQMCNLELIDGVSFRKGCYTGQEIVARTQHLGKVKRRLYRAHIPATAGVVPAIGDALFSDDTGDQANGMLLSVAPAGPAGETAGHAVLAVVQTSSHDHSQVHLGSANGTTLQFRPLPYALPE